MFEVLLLLLVLFSSLLLLLRVLSDNSLSLGNSLCFLLLILLISSLLDCKLIAFNLVSKSSLFIFSINSFKLSIFSSSS